jgi:isoleucyl-tRNA synthetase
MSEKYDAHKVEDEMLQFWEKHAIYQKSQKKNKGKKTFTFLQGPPYTSGRLHIGHAWNNALKDVILRYKRMQGFDVWDRAGYDMHGLPTENKVQAKHKLKYKEDIEKFGLKKFIEECISFSSDNAKQMDKDLWKLGIWMDYETAYWPIRNDYIENEWWLVKKAHEKKRLYKDKKVMTWCSQCETALAKHELEYDNLNEPSIFLKFKINSKNNKSSKSNKSNTSSKKNDKGDAYLLIWTTTPWTIPFNLAVMVNPELNYVKIEVETETGKEQWWIAEALVGTFMGNVVDYKYKIIETVKGKELEGIKYEHPLQEEFTFAQENITINPENIHSVILSEEYVDTSAGTGLVHCAPGCGPEDYEVGRSYGLGAFKLLSALALHVLDQEFDVRRRVLLYVLHLCLGQFSFVIILLGLDDIIEHAQVLGRHLA